MAEGPEQLRTLAEAVLAGGPDVLIPERLRGAVSLPEGMAVADRLDLCEGVSLVVLTGGGEVVAAPVIREGGVVRRAGPGDGAFEGLLERMQANGSDGAFQARRYGPRLEFAGERRIDADQSNDSFVVGEQVVVKAYTRTLPGAQPGLDLPAHLRAVGFERTPELLGSLTWSGLPGAALLATASRFLRGARDGWEWYVDLVSEWLGGGPDAVEPAADIGGLVAELHVALATRSEVIPEPVRAATSEEGHGWRARALATLEEALEVTGGEEGERLRDLAARARQILEGPTVLGAVMRVHGDLHVGQILKWEGGLAVSDFDGNPLAPADVRTAPDTPMRDVASMARALDHVGRVVQRRRPGDAEQTEGWISAARTAFFGAYRETMRGAGDPVPFVEELLLPLEVAQECHEYVYAARYLPRWLYVPDLAMPALLRGDSRT